MRTEKSASDANRPFFFAFRNDRRDDVGTEVFDGRQAEADLGFVDDGKIREGLVGVRRQNFNAELV